MNKSTTRLPVAFVIDKDGNAWNMLKNKGGFVLASAGVNTVHRFSGDLIIGKRIEFFPLGTSDIDAAIGDEPIRVTLTANSMLFLEMFSSNWKEFAYWLSKKKIQLEIVGSKSDPLTVAGQVVFIVDGEYPCHVYLNDYWIGFLGKYATNLEKLKEAR